MNENMTQDQRLDCLAEEFRADSDGYKDLQIPSDRDGKWRIRRSLTYDNEEWAMKAMTAQSFVKDADGVFQIPEDRNISMRIPTELIPKCDRTLQ